MEIIIDRNKEINGIFLSTICLFKTGNKDNVVLAKDSIRKNYSSYNRVVSIGIGRRNAYE
jgi:hypothetical protein